jgi:hypothetical protein
MAYVFAQFYFFFYFARVNNTAFLAALKKFSLSFEKNPLPLLLALVYLAAFSIYRFDLQTVRWTGI